MRTGFIPTDDRILNEFPWSGDQPREGFANGWPFEVADDQLVDRVRRMASLMSAGFFVDGGSVDRDAARKFPERAKPARCECEHADHFEDGLGHGYGLVGGVEDVATEYGRFTLCAACVAGHGSAF